MDNIYLVVTPDDFTASINIKKITDKLTDYEIINYDLKEITIDQVIEDLDTYNFLSPHKCIIANNATFLTSEKDLVEHNIDRLTKYLDNPNPDNILILTCSKLDERKKLAKTILNKAKLISGEVDIKKLIRENLDGYQMDINTINFLIEYCLNNNEKIMMELEKLKLYKYEEKTITTEDIKLLVIKSIDDNIFSLIDCILLKKKSEAFEIYESLIEHNESPTKILVLLANQIRLMYQVKVLANDKLTDIDISKQLGVHKYPVKLAREKGYNYSSKELLNMLDTLAELDYKMKSGKIVENIGLELFIAEL